MSASCLQVEELVNTAPLTGHPGRIPVRLVTVDTGGVLVEVTEHIGCESANTQVLQVRIHGQWGSAHTIPFLGTLGQPVLTHKLLRRKNPGFQPHLRSRGALYPQLWAHSC